MASAVRHLVIMAKVPVAGRVKTRLASGIGAVHANAFYRRELFALLRRVSFDTRWHTSLAVVPDTGVTFGPWPGHVRCIPQGPGDLGRRMARIMAILPPGPAIIIGSDIPGLSSSHIAEGFRVLGGNDAVFGPVPDGGYYLVGLKRTPKVLNPFTNVRWSSPHALKDTAANLDGRRIAYLSELADIDTAEDLTAFRLRRQNIF